MIEGDEEGKLLTTMQSGKKGKGKRRLLVKFGVMLFSFVFAFGLFEIILRLGWLDQETSSRPIWFPPRLVEADKAIDLKNWEYAKKNPYRFTDKVRSKRKPAGTVRVAVLGDSFIWGDGLPYEEVWSHKLEKLFASHQSPEIEVMSWGRNGWATQEEAGFLAKYGHQYDIDILVFGWVTNDPDMEREHGQRYFKWQDSFIWKPAWWCFPYASKFASASINKFLEQRSEEYGYFNWEDRLYSKDNLSRYEALLRGIDAFCKKKQITLIFALTPNNHLPRFRKLYDRVIPLFERVGITYIDLYPEIKNQLGHLSPRELFANPADGHPGPRQTSIFASELYKVLKADYIKEIRKNHDSVTRMPDSGNGRRVISAPPSDDITNAIKEVVIRAER